MRTAAALALLACQVLAQSIGIPVNVTFSSNNNVSPQNQELGITADGRAVAVTGSLPTIADVLVVEVGPTGSPTAATNILFPGNNDLSGANPALVASRQGHFFCCYGSNGTGGDVVFISRNAGGTWNATNVLFPNSNDVPAVGTRPVISDDETFIVCRGLSAIAEFVIIPVVAAAGVFSPGTPFSEAAPGGNTVPLAAVNPVIAPNSRSFAIAGSSAAVGDLMIGTVGFPVTAANTTIANVLFPGSNNLLSNLVPPLASPASNYYAVHGQPSTGDLVVVAMSAAGAVGTITNVLWPLNNNTGFASMPPPPPSVSADGRLIAVNGSDSTNGDVVLVPINSAGVPGPAANVAFPASNNVPNLQLPPVVSSDAALVVHRGSAAIGDLVAIQVIFASPTSISGSQQNVLYPSSNNVPNIDAHVALAPDRSYAVTLGMATTGDLVITPFNAAGFAQLPINVLYPASNNVANLASTPRISREGNLVVTNGTSTIGDAVITGIDVDYSTALVQNTFTTNVLYPAMNDNSPTSREPVFSSTTQFVVTTGISTIGDLVFIPLLDAFPRFRARADAGATVPVRFFSPTNPGKVVIGAAAFGRDTGTFLPDFRIFPLDNDPLLAFSTVANPVFVSLVGALDANGVYDGAAVNVPALASAQGIVVYLAFVVLDPAAPLGIGTISRPAALLVE